MPPAKKPAAKPKAKAESKSPAKAKAKVEAKPPTEATTTHSTPAVNTQHAAALVGNKVEPTAGTTPVAESAMFRHLKQTMSKPHSAVIGGLLDKMGPAGQKKSNLPFTGDKQVGHNQTVGSDASRRNVPRRTGG